MTTDLRQKGARWRCACRALRSDHGYPGVIRPATNGKQAESERYISIRTDPEDEGSRTSEADQKGVSVMHILHCGDFGHQLEGRYY